MPQTHVRTAALAAVLVLAGCGPAATSPGAPTAGTAPGSEPTGAATPAVTPDPGAGALTGAWTGSLEDQGGAYPVIVTLDGCGEPGSVCGEIEYLDSAVPDSVMCASELTLTSRDGARLSFSERYVYRGWMCLPTTFVMTPTAAGDLEAEQYVGGTEPCCRGTLTARAGPAPAPELPGALGDLGRATSATALGGATTQYGSSGAGALWIPLEDTGEVARIDPATGAIVARIRAGDPGSLDGLKSDPHGVAAGDTGAWVAQAAERAVSRIDPATNSLVDTIDLPATPYALALDGTTLWVTSFENDRVLRVDLPARTVVASIDVAKPTGIAVGLGGVWVVGHRSDTLHRIDPATNKLVASISLGERGPNEACGMCVENVVIGSGSVWTANNEGRSVSRVDPATNKVIASIDLPLRPWAVSAGDGRIWASQFEGRPDGSFVGPARWAVASIDPATNEATSFAVPAALGVLWAENALWVIQPWRRGDVLVRIELAGS